MLMGNRGWRWLRRCPGLRRALGANSRRSPRLEAKVGTERGLPRQGRWGGEERSPQLELGRWAGGGRASVGFPVGGGEGVGEARPGRWTGSESRDRM